MNKLKFMNDAFLFEVYLFCEYKMLINYNYGISHIEGDETCIDGIVTLEFIDELLNPEEPETKSIYNKMTKYFTKNECARSSGTF